MRQERCEEMMLAIMAIADGEKPLLPAEVVTVHVENCVKCRQEVDQLAGIATLLEGQQRRRQVLDLWPALEDQLRTMQAEAAPVAAARMWPAFFVLGLLLVTYKLAEMIPERDLGLLFKLVPLLAVIIVFRYLKENPFKINLELTLEGDR